MKNLLTNLFNSSFYCHVMRLAMAVVLLSFATVATAGGGSDDWSATYRAHIELHPDATGTGKVYISSSTNSISYYFTDENGRSSSQKDQQKEIAKSSDRYFSLYKSGTSDDPFIFLAVNIAACPLPGSKFEAWYKCAAKYATPQTATEGVVINDGIGIYTLGEKSISKNSSTVEEYYYAQFTARTYHAKWPKIEIITKDASGNTISGVNGGTVRVSLGKPIATGDQSGETEAKAYTSSATPDDIFTQTADNNGEFAKATYQWTISIEPNTTDNYFLESATYNSATITNAEIVAGIPFTEITTAEEGVNVPLQQETITVVFKKKFIAHFEGPSIAFATNSANNGSITIGDEDPITQVGDVINLKSKSGSVENMLSYAYTYTANNTDKATFVGWSLTEDGSSIIPESRGQQSYTHHHSISPNNLGSEEQPLLTPTLYAVYESFYYESPKLSFTNGSAGLGKIAVKTDGSDPIESDWSDTNIENVTTVQTATGGQASKVINYYYHAQTVQKNDKFTIFKGFAADKDGNTILSTSNTQVYVAQIEVNSKNSSDPSPCPYIVYADFAESTTYWYKGAIGKFAVNGENGIITVSNTTPGASAIDWSATSESGIDDSNNKYQTAADEQSYQFTYEAAYPDEVSRGTMAWKGWSRSPFGEKIVDDGDNDEMKYVATYSTFEKNEKDAADTKPLYAIFRSFWYADPTVMRLSGDGEMAWVYSTTAPTDDDWKKQTWASQHVASINPQDLNQVAAHGENIKYTIWYKAQGNFGSVFKGWTHANDANTELIEQNPYRVDYTVTSMDDEAPFIPARLYAVFQSVIEVIQQDRMIYYVDENGDENINEANVIINFNKANTLNAELIKVLDKDGQPIADEIFTLSDKQRVDVGRSVTLDATKGIMQLVLSYAGDNPKSHIGAKATIKLSSEYPNEQGKPEEASVLVEITIEEQPTITFLPTDGKGRYTIRHTDGRGKSYTIEQDATENVYVPIAQENMATLELEISDKEGDSYTFAGWQMIVDNTPTYFSQAPKCTYTFKESVVVRPVFSVDDRASFIILNDPMDRPYYDLQEALDDAEKLYVESGTSKTMQIVVFSDGNIDTNGKTKRGVLYQGDYVIPEGVTLLIPGVGPDDNIAVPNPDEENRYLYRLKTEGTVTGQGSETTIVVLTGNDYTTTSSSAVCYRKLYVEANTTITVKEKGNLYLYALLNRNGQYYDARPYSYGQMDLGPNCEIILESGSALYAYGYITGDHSSKVIANSGSEVYEVFQYSDPRGGMGIAHLFLARKDYRVFPFNQYYIQNVEIPLELQYGAKEYITTTADVLDNKYVITAPFVISDDEDKDVSGLFRLGENTSLTKYYDPITDRQKYILSGDETSSPSRLGFILVRMGDLSQTVGTLLNEMIKNKLGGISLGGSADNLAAYFIPDLTNVQLDSREYVLPMNNNMDIILNNTTLEVSRDYAFLAGSSMTVNEGAVMKLESGAKIYLYDEKENHLPGKESVYTNGAGYFANENLLLDPIVSTPNNSQYLKDAAGKLVFKRTASGVKDARWLINGRVEVDANAGFYTTKTGAQIISTKTGVVNFKGAVSNAITYQAEYKTNSATELIEISVIPLAVKIKTNGIHNRITYDVTSSKLQNANGEYVATSAGEYTYDPYQGKWILNSSSQPLSGAEVRVTLPDYDWTTEEIDPYRSTTLTHTAVSSATIKWNDGTATTILQNTITTDAQGTHIPVIYTPVNKAGEYEGLLTINRPNNASPYYNKIRVIEDYTPAFKVMAGANEVTTYSVNGYMGEITPSTSTTFMLTPDHDNVAGILTGHLAERVAWSYTITGLNADEFEFLWGSEGENYLSGATLSFKPKTIGSKTALLSLTCTYTDGDKDNNGKFMGNRYSTTLTIPLTAHASGLAANTLAFADDINSIFISSAPFALFDANSRNNMQDLKITYSSDDVLEVMEGEDYEQNIFVKPAVGSVGRTIVVTASQDPDITNGVAGIEISKTITITEDIVWNWKNLYFGATETNPVSVHTGCQVTSIEISSNHNYGTAQNPQLGYGDPDKVVESFVKNNASSAYKDNISIFGWEIGETEVWFTVNYKLNGVEQVPKEFKSEVYRDPQHLPISVNEDRIYEAVTWSHKLANYNAAEITFGDPIHPQVAQWTFTFIGIPDQLTFKANGRNNWQIEESDNSVNWSIIHTWAQISPTEPFAINLHPSTRYVRISYGMENGSRGVLSDVAVSELKTVRADVEKLYMPDPTSTKSIVYTYISETPYLLGTSSVDKFTLSNTDVDKEDKPILSGGEDYQIKRVNVTSHSTNSEIGYVDVMRQNKGLETRVPIQTFAEQAIPIQLASDYEERYYYVTIESYHASWDADNHQIVMNNAVADADPYVVFHFKDNPAPGITSFNFTPTAKGTWRVEESVDGTDWKTMSANAAENLGNHFVMRDFKNNPNISRYVRITYESDYAEIIELSNVSVLPSANVAVDPSELQIYDSKNEKLSITANNIHSLLLEFTPNNGSFAVAETETGAALNGTDLTTLLKALYADAESSSKSLELYIKYTDDAMVTYGSLAIYTTHDAMGKPLENGKKELLATIQLTGLKNSLPVESTGIKTGTGLKINGFDKNKEAALRDVNTEYAFHVVRDAEGKITTATPLFDYVIIYGETTTTDNTAEITSPTSTTGSNAKTPCYIYKKSNNTYQLELFVENANSSTKSWNGEKGAMTVPDTRNLKVYITGFCPYASTGYSKSDEGVWYFRGTSGDNIDVYLEDCYIYSRYKSRRGNSFDRESGETYSDKVARGSGAVLLFSNTNSDETQSIPMNVTIHTRRTNLLKSHYGCLFESIVGRAFQASAPVQIYMQSVDHYNNSYTTLTFDDKWPTSAEVDDKGAFVHTDRTNGFLSLRKQVHNAPSIDMGNKNTVVNFRGGQIELQNALNSSDNYESTLAISYRTGMYGPAKFRFTLSHGIGTDGTEGTVNFYDGTTTVTSMTVPERYRQYYLMDENGTTTSCLRSQKNTFVYGGSHCMMRACPEPTDKGGAPKSGPDGVELGLYKYPAAPIKEKDEQGNPTDIIAHKGGWTVKNGWENIDGAQLVTPDYVPAVPANYGIESITPNTNGTNTKSDDDYLNLWVTSDFDKSVVPEVNIPTAFWKACMTKIAAEYGIYSGEIGGMTEIAFEGETQAEEVYNLLYCKIDENIQNVIAATGKNQYYAPVLYPAPTTDINDKYMTLAPTSVGGETHNYITNVNDYVVKNKVYYIVPATADVWMAFTAPFDVEKIYIMETRHEQDLHTEVIDSMRYGVLEQWKESTYRMNMLQMQAKHNADFAAFFGVALALESKKPFEDIFADYIGWANWKDGAAKRNKYELVHYYNTYDNQGNLETSNWDHADYYLYKNTGDWELKQPNAEGNQEGNQRFTTKWEFVAPPAKGKALLEQGETYSMLFPYCTACYDENVERDFWDYWTGKFLIFESIDGANVKDANNNVIGHHIIKGSSFVGSSPVYELEGPDTDQQLVFKNWNYADGELINHLSSRAEGTYAVLTGNSTFAPMKTENLHVLPYYEVALMEEFMPQPDIKIEPTQSFLFANVATITSSGQSLLGIGRDGTIRYGGNNSGSQNGTSGGGHMPTVGGGNDMFITAIEGGINIAVAEPQMVKVMSSTGAVLFAGYITTATDVQLPTHGIYIVSGENEVQKILH